MEEKNKISTKVVTIKKKPAKQKETTIFFLDTNAQIKHFHELPDDKAKKKFVNKFIKAINAYHNYDEDFINYKKESNSKLTDKNDSEKKRKELLAKKMIQFISQLNLLDQDLREKYKIYLNNNENIQIGWGDECKKCAPCNTLIFPNAKTININSTTQIKATQIIAPDATKVELWNFNNLKQLFCSYEIEILKANGAPQCILDNINTNNLKSLTIHNNKDLYNNSIEYQLSKLENLDIYFCNHMFKSLIETLGSDDEKHESRENHTNLINGILPGILKETLNQISAKFNAVSKTTNDEDKQEIIKVIKDRLSRCKLHIGGKNVADVDKLCAEKINEMVNQVIKNKRIFVSGILRKKDSNFNQLNKNKKNKLTAMNINLKNMIASYMTPDDIKKILPKSSTQQNLNTINNQCNNIQK